MHLPNCYLPASVFCDSPYLKQQYSIVMYKNFPDSLSFPGLNEIKMLL